jgi:hypothetical protein
MKDCQAGVEAYMGYLESLRKADDEYFLEGGQAVNFWAEYIDARIQCKPLNEMRPFTSKDCDIWVSFKTWQKLKKNPALKKSSSPIDGQLGILCLSDEPPRVVDMLQSVYGIEVKEYPRLLERALDDGKIRVIDPIYLFRSKCHCFMGLPQGDRQDERHVRMLALILPEYISLLIDESDRGNIPDRDLLKEIKLLKKISSSAVCRRCMESLGIACESLIPWGRIARSQSPLLAKYAQEKRLIA